MIWLWLLPAGLALLLLSFLAGVLGQRHHFLGRVPGMSLLDDVETVIAKIEGDVEAAVEAAIGPLNAKIASLEAELAASTGIVAKLEALGESVVGKITAASAAPAETPPTA
jgi:hypothetical protein